MTGDLKLASGLFIAGLVATLAAQPGDRPSGPPPRRYEFLRGGQVVGHQTVDSNGSTVTARFDGTDGGRPWRFDESATLDTNGIPVSVDVTGTDAAGQPIRDRYRTAAGTATWHNDAESGSGPASHRFYLTMPVLEGQMAAMPDELGRLTRALLASPTRSLALAPAAAATVRQIGPVSVSGRNGAKQVVQYEIRGLDYAPFQIWLQPDGTLFAAFTAGTIVREGWNDVVPALLAARDAALRADEEALQRQIAQPLVGPLAFMHARVFDPRTMSVRERMTVVVNGRTIDAVGADGTVRLASNLERIDARGDTLIPGLWDMHTHLTRTDGLLHISAGVTTVRDLGNDVDQVLAMRRDFAEGRATGPRVLLAGLIDGRGPYQGPTKLLFLNFMPDVKHLESPERVTATADGAAKIDLDSQAVHEFLGFLAQHRTIVDPTLSTWETRLLARAGQIDPAVAPVFDRLPLRPRRAALRAGLPATPEQLPHYRDAFAAMLRMDRLLYDRGVRLVTGSDGLARFGFDRELELEVQAGMPAARVLRMATLDAAQLMHRDRELGTIEVGKLADLVLVAGAPDLHISDVRRVRYVVKDGAAFRVDVLDRALSLTGVADR